MTHELRLGPTPPRSALGYTSQRPLPSSGGAHKLSFRQLMIESVGEVSTPIPLPSIGSAHKLSFRQLMIESAGELSPLRYHCHLSAALTS